MWHHALMKVIIGITLPLALGGFPAQAAIYYVSPQGNDSNTGISPDQAWKTVAKVNAGRFMSGDEIRFARGGQWRESLRASSSGSAGNPIVFAAYGEGPKPRFYGSDVIANAEFAPFKGSTYQWPSARRVASVLVDHQFLLAADMPGVLSKPNTWHHDGKALFVNLDGRDPRTDKRLYTACVRVDCIHSNGKSHLVFRDLVGDESADVRDGYAFRVMGSDDVRLENCEAYRAGRHHFGTINSTRFVGKNLYCAYAMPNVPGGATFYVSFSDPSRSADTHQWIDCAAEHLENPNQGSYQVFYDHGEGLGPILIQNMRSKGGKFSVGTSAKAPVTIQGGLLEDASLEIFGSHARVDGLTIRGNGAIDHWGSECVFQNIEMVNITAKNGGQTGYSSAIVLRDGAKRNTFRFNTIVMDPSAPASATCLSFVGRGSATRWYGNIALSQSRAVKSWTGKLDSGDVAMADFNWYATAARFLHNDDKAMSLAEWKAQGFDVHSHQGDPLFLDPTKGNFALKPESPARSAAKVEAALRPATDIAGTARNGPACDLGSRQTK